MHSLLASSEHSFSFVHPCLSELVERSGEGWGGFVLFTSMCMQALKMLFADDRDHSVSKRTFKRILYDELDCLCKASREDAVETGGDLDAGYRGKKCGEEQVRQDGAASESAL